ncbi:unnamed protein product, partial [Chrysoparadoxa australica]
ASLSLVARSAALQEIGGEVAHNSQFLSPVARLMSWSWHFLFLSLSFVGALRPAIPSPQELFDQYHKAYLERRQNKGQRDAGRRALEHSFALRPDWHRVDARLLTSEAVNLVLSDFEDPGCEMRQQVEVIREALLLLQYTPQSVQERLGVPESRMRMPGPFFMKRSITHQNGIQVGDIEDPLDLAIQLFLLGFAVPRSQVEEYLSGTALAAMEALHLVEAGRMGIDGEVAMIQSMVQIFPMDCNVMHSTSPNNMLIVTDFPPPHSISLTEEPVMYIGVDSIGLVQHAPRPQAQHVLDLCTGSGIQGIVAALTYPSHVTCVDISPRAVRFARFNAALNCVGDRLDVREGDLYEVLGPEERFDVVLANPPFVPCPSTVNTRGRYDVFASGGTSGESILQVCYLFTHLHR